MLDVVGEHGLLVSGLHTDVVVDDVLGNFRRWLHISRSRMLVIRLLKQCIPNHEFIIEVDVVYVWQLKNTLSDSPLQLHRIS